MGTSQDARTGDVMDMLFQREIKALALASLRTTRPEQVRPAALRRFRRAAFNYHSRLGQPSELWGWKFPETYLIGPLIASAFPQARYLHLIRDGRDVAFKQHLTDDPKRKLGRAILELTGCLNRPRHIQAAKSWAFQVEHFESFRSSLPGAQVLDVKFDQLCERPHETVDAICQFLGIRMTERCRKYVDEEIDASKVAQYRQSEPQLVSDVETEIGATLRQHGYAP